MQSLRGSAVPPLIEFDRNSGVPFFKQIYSGFREAILSGRLRPGQRLPSTRGLAKELGISRLPAIIAFEQLLHEGYIEGKIGAGSYVKDSIPDDLGRPANQPGFPNAGSDKPVDSNLPSNERILGPFRVSLPALDHFPHAVWSQLVSRHARNLSLKNMAYGDPAGHLPLREAIADYLRTARAVRCEAGQILIVSGSQMALQICAAALLKKGESACIEEPGYSGARNALKSAGATLVATAVDCEGIRVTEIDKHGRSVRLCYVTPSHQYPLGMSMTATRRLALLDWAQSRKSWIIEDDYDSEFRYASRPLGALQGMRQNSRVIYVGTFSKVLFPALRIGYMVVPPGLFDRFLNLREAFDLFSPTLYQLVLTDFLQQGHFARHLRRMRSVYLNRRNAMLTAIEDHLAKHLAPHNSDAGLHLSAFFHKDKDDLAVVDRAAEEGISVTALSPCYAGKRIKKGLILGYGAANERQIKTAAQKLAKVLQEFS